jgi:hypothetical protein
MDSPFADLENGRRVGPRSDEAQKIAAIRADCVANGVRYPSRNVDDLYEQPSSGMGAPPTIPATTPSSVHPRGRGRVR